MFCKNNIFFGKSIVGRTNETLTTKNAMSVYKEMILKGNGFNTNDIDSLITKTKGEIRYNLVLIREKLMEVEEVIESEVVPVWNESMKIRESFDLKRKNIMLDEINNVINDNKYNEISKIIFKNYLLFLLK